MTKQEILDYFSLIDFAYNESGRLESLSRMIDELLEEQDAIKPFSDDDGAYWCGSCHEDMVWHQKFCSNCGRPVLWECR